MPPLSRKGLADVTNREPYTGPSSVATKTNKESYMTKNLDKAFTGGSVGPASPATSSVVPPPTHQPSPKQPQHNMSTSCSALSVDSAAAIYRDPDPSEASKKALAEWWADCHPYPEESTMPCCRLKTHQLKHPEDTENVPRPGETASEFRARKRFDAFHKAIRNGEDVRAKGLDPGPNEEGLEYFAFPNSLAPELFAELGVHLDETRLADIEDWEVDTYRGCTGMRPKEGRIMEVRILPITTRGLFEKVVHGSGTGLHATTCRFKMRESGEEGTSWIHKLSDDNGVDFVLECKARIEALRRR